MLGSALSVSETLFVVGGVSGELNSPVALDKIYILVENKWQIWARMSECRLNHNCVTYSNILLILGGHTIVSNVPKPVTEAICFDVRASKPREYKTPILGSSKIGLGIAMVGDVGRINEVRGSSKISSSKLGQSSQSSDQLSFLSRA